MDEISIWIALVFNALGLIGALIYNAAKVQTTAESMKSGMIEIKKSLIRMEDRAERSSNEIRVAMQSMVDKLYDLGGRVSKLEGITAKK